MKIIFWQNVLSIHQKDLLIALSKKVDVYLVYEEELYESRKKMGWEVPTFDGVKLIHINDISLYIDKMYKTFGQDYHIFSGINAYAKISIYFNKFYKQDSSRVMVFLEKPGGLDTGIKKLLREIKYRYFSYKYKNIKYLLTPGGEAYLKHVGFLDNRIIPFSYFGPSINNNLNSSQNEVVTFIYVGSLIKLKNILLALSSFSKMDSAKYRFNIVGDGKEKEFLKSFVNNKKLMNINFLGSQSNQEVLSMISQSDCLILPSSYDGWGYVVNEALSVGTQVICSNACGVSSMSDKFKNLLVFKSNDEESLIAQLNIIVKQGSLTNAIRKEYQANFENNLSGKAGALRLLALLKR